MPKFVAFTAPNQTPVYVDPHQVVRVYPRLTGAGSCLNLSNGQSQDILELPEEVIQDLEGAD